MGDIRAIRLDRLAWLAAAALCLGTATAAAETPAETTARCQNQCRPLLSAGYSASETRRIVNNCLVLCRGANREVDDFLICPDGIGYKNLPGNKCPEPKDD